MSRLNLLLLGPPEIFIGEKRLDIVRRLPRILLFYLAERGEPVSREALLDTLWDDQQTDLTKRKRHLSVVIHRLKTAIPEGVLQVDRHMVALDPQGVEVDVWRFRQQCEDIRAALRLYPEHKPLPQFLANQIESALALWHGATFLEGVALPDSVGLSDWLHWADSQLQEERKMLLHHLVTHYERLGDFGAAITRAQQWCRLDPVDVSAHARLITLYHLAQRPGAVEEHLAALYQHNPDDADYVVDSLRKEYPDLLVAAPRPAAGVVDDHAPAQRQTPLLGKKIALMQLHSAVEGGKGALVVASYGMGKSLLLKQFVQRLPENRWVMFHRCGPDEAERPFASLTALLEENLTEEDWAALEDQWPIRLRVLRPGFADPPAGEGAAERQGEQITLAWRSFAARLSRERPLLICLDDVQWMDEATLHAVADMLHHLRRRAPVLMACEMAYRARLDSRLRPLLQSGLWSEVTLSPLTLEESHQMITSRLGDAVSQAFTDFFYYKSGGNPALLDALLQQYVEQYPDLDFTIPPEEISYPEEIEAAYRDLLGVLSPEQRAVLEAVSLYSRPVSSTVLARFLDEDPTEVVRHLETLVMTGWVRVEQRQDGPETWRLAHDLVRQVVLHETPLARQQSLHRRIAAVLQDAPHLSSDPLEIADHLQAGGDDLGAFERFLALAQQGMVEGRLNDAQSALERAESVLMQSPERFADHTTYRLYEVWDHVLAIRDRPDEMEAAFRRLLALAKQRGSPLLQGMALYGLADACLSRNHFDEGLLYVEQAIDHLRHAEHPLRLLWAQVLQAVLWYMKGLVGRAMQRFSEVLRQLDSMEPTPEMLELRGHVCYQVSLLETLRGRPQQGRAFGLRALRDYQETQNRFGRLLALNNLALAAYFQAEFVEAHRYSADAVDLARNIHSMRFLGYSAVYSAMALLAQGEVERAVDQAYQAISMGQLYRHHDLEAAGYRVVGEAYFHLGALEAALEWYRKAEELAHRTFLEPDISLRIGITQLRLNRGEQARGRIQRAMAVAQTIGQEYVTLVARLAQAEILGLGGEWSKAVALAADAGRAARERGLRLEALAADFLQAQGAWYQGDRERAFSSLEALLNEAAHMGHFWWRLTMMRLWCRWAQQLGRPREAMHQTVLEQLSWLQGRVQQPGGSVVTTKLSTAVDDFITHVQRQLL